MKKILLLCIATVISFISFAQRHITNDFRPLQNYYPSHGIPCNNIHAKTTLGTTDTLSNITPNDTLTVYYVGSGRGDDSGYSTGTNIYNDMGFAERYDFNGGDSSVKVIGVFALFTGTVNDSSTQTVTFNIWDIGAKVMASANVFYSGYPNNNLDSIAVPVTQLGIGKTKDTLKMFLFPTPTTALSAPFFAGYTMQYNFRYLNQGILSYGDTIALQCSANGERKIHQYYIDTIYNTTTFTTDTLIDTIVNVQNVTLWADGYWHDNYTQNDSVFNDLAIYPIIVSSSPNGIKGITKHNLTFFGNYPNPALKETNIRFSLADNEDVFIQVADVNGNILTDMTNRNLTVGEHIISLNTGEYAAGDYFYLIRTSGGEGFAGKICVLR